MGKLNLLKADYQGKVGKTVGQKWKNRTNICSYTKHGDAKTTAQIIQRARHLITVQVLSSYYQKCPELLKLDNKKSTKFQDFQKKNRSFINPDLSINLPLNGFTIDTQVIPNGTISRNWYGTQLSFSDYINRPEHTLIGESMLILHEANSNKVRVLKGDNGIWSLTQNTDKSGVFNLYGIALVASNPDFEYATFTWWTQAGKRLNLPLGWIDGIII